MKDIYSKENIIRSLKLIQKRFNNLYNKKFSIEEIIYAFNCLSGKYQDVLLICFKDENEKALSRIAYENMRRTLLLSKNITKDNKVKLKNYNKKIDEVKKNDDELDIEMGPEAVLGKNKLDKKTVINEETKEDSKQVATKKYYEELNKRIKKIVLEEYSRDRKKVNIDSDLKKLNLTEDEKFIVLIKYDNNSVKTNEEVAKELNLDVEYVDNIIEDFLKKVIKLKQKKIYKLERKQ